MQYKRGSWGILDNTKVGIIHSNPGDPKTTEFHVVDNDGETVQIIVVSDERVTLATEDAIPLKRR